VIFILSIGAARSERQAAKTECQRPPRLNSLLQNRGGLAACCCLSWRAQFLPPSFAGSTGRSPNRGGTSRWRRAVATHFSAPTGAQAHQSSCRRYLALQRLTAQRKATIHSGWERTFTLSNARQSLR